MTSVDKLDHPEVMWKLLTVLAKAQWDDEKHYSQEPSAQRLRQQAKNRFNPLSHGTLAGHKPGDSWEFPRTNYLHLPPYRGKGRSWILPVARAAFESKNGHQVFRLQIGILVEVECENEGGEVEKLHHGIGVRFEGKESPLGGGDHDYAHAQWFCAFDQKMPIEGCPDWLPDSYPAIPIPAVHAVDILCCALKSLYGAQSDLLPRLAKQVATNPEYRPFGREAGICIDKWASSARPILAP